MHRSIRLRVDSASSIFASICTSSPSRLHRRVLLHLLVARRRDGRRPPPCPRLLIDDLLLAVVGIAAHLLLGLVLGACGSTSTADERLHSSGKSVRKESVPTAKRWRPGPCLSLLVSKKAAPLSIAYLESRHERMVVIVIGSIIASSLRNMSGLAFDRKQAIFIFFGVPWLSFLIKLFCFDLSPHPADKAKHAMRISWRRGALWSMSHLPLFGTVLWMAATLELRLSVADKSCEASISFSAALAAFLVCTAAIHTVTRGKGKGRRSGCRARDGRRSASPSPSLQCGLPAFVCFGAMTSSVYYPVVLGVLTIEALVELWGLGERAADGTVRTTAAEEAEAAANAAASVAAAPAAAPAQRAAIARRVTTLLRAERIASVLREQRDSERRSSWFTRMSAVRRDGAMG